MNVFKTLLILGVVFLLVSSCSEDKDEPKNTFQTDLDEVTSFANEELTITLFATEPFFVGYNKIEAKIADSEGNLIEAGDAMVMPRMDMMEMSHACPKELPNGSQFTDGKLNFNLMFVMPSGEMGTWSITFAIEDGITTRTIEVPITVMQPAFTRMVSFVSAVDESKYFIGMATPTDPLVGMNELELVAFKRMSMMDWPATSSLSFEIEPWMPSMDHGSPNNVDPVHDHDGHYMGQVNFTMTGDWEIRATVSEAGQVIGEPVFALTLQ